MTPLHNLNALLEQVMAGQPVFRGTVRIAHYADQVHAIAALGGFTTERKPSRIHPE